MALWTFALDVAVRQKHLFDRIKKLLDGFSGYLAVGLERLINATGKLAVFFRIGGVVVIKLHQKIGKISTMFGMNALDQLLRCDAFLFCTQHDGRAVSIVGT